MRGSRSSPRCAQDATLPLSKPVRGVDGTMMSTIPVPKGTTIVVGVRGCNLNPDIWGPDAQEWKPDRWLSPLPESVKKAKIPGVYSNMYVLRSAFAFMS